MAGIEATAAESPDVTHSFDHVRVWGIEVISEAPADPGHVSTDPVWGR